MQQPLTCQSSSSAICLQDLLRAAEKALASGMGDWHLQALQDISPQFQEHVLMGALGPETLKHKHKLPEQQILQLYGLLHRHSTVFQQEVQAALAGASHTEQLLASIWTAFAQLWDECVQVRRVHDVAFHQRLQDALKCRSCWHQLWMSQPAQPMPAAPQHGTTIL
jgi:hypothetical protein